MTGRRADLTTTYLGLALRNPLVASASPLSQDVAGVRRLAQAGVGAIVLPSLMEEEVRRQEVRDFLRTAVHEEAFAEAATYLPPSGNHSVDGIGQYLDLISGAVEAVDVPIIASLNGASLGGWTSIAARMQEAGAAAIELNIYAVPGDLNLSGADIDRLHVEILRRVRAAVSIPVAVKLSPYFSNTAVVAMNLVDAGADGLVLFNRFLQPDIDTEQIAVVPRMYLSRPEDGRLPRSWIALLRHRVPATSLALTSGVWHAEDVVKGLLAGADVVMTASALLDGGVEQAGRMLDGLDRWLAARGLLSVDEMRGVLAVPLDTDGGAEERAGYVEMLTWARARWGDLGWL